jgi:hypothetical protein
MDADPIGNMRITSLEITQGIQDLYNSVMLIQNRRTFVRLHVKSDEEPISGVTAYLYRINFFGQIVDGPLVPVNPVGPQNRGWSAGAGQSGRSADNSTDQSRPGQPQRQLPL